jgi:uncharacterized protein (TIGR02996 family)
MPIEDAFLQDIRQHPGDDTPRLILADWLDERGDADRAEFIRVQCALAAAADDDPSRGRLAERERKLLEGHAGRWVGELAEWLEGWEFRRGFLESVTATARTFLDVGARLAAPPTVRRLRLVNAGRFLHAVALSPHLARFAALDLSGNGVDADGAAALSGSPYLAGLTRLDLGDNLLGDAGVRMVARSRRLPGLTDLNLRNNNVGDAGLQALGAADHLPRLCRLNLASNHVTCEGVAALARSPLGARLATLDLAENYVGCRGVGALAGSPQLRSLRALRLARNQIAGHGARALAGSPLLEQLTELEMEHNRPVYREGWGVLEKSPHWRRLTRQDPELACGTES